MRYTVPGYTVEHYRNDGGEDVIGAWFQSLRDRRAAARIIARIERLAVGLFGDCKLLRDGIWEMRIDEGPGYRVYYARVGHRVVLLLCGGDKRTQVTDIRRAIDYWHDWQERTRHEEGTRKPPAR